MTSQTKILYLIHIRSQSDAESKYTEYVTVLQISLLQGISSNTRPPPVRTPRLLRGLCGRWQTRFRHFLVDHHCECIHNVSNSSQMTRHVACLSTLPCPGDRRCQSRRSSDPVAPPWARPTGHGKPADAHCQDLSNTLRSPHALASKYGCFNASSTSIRRLGENVRHFSIRSIACENEV